MKTESDFKQEKTLLRKELIALRKNMSFDEKKRFDLSIYEQVINLEEFINASLLLTYVSTGIEVDTIDIISKCFQLGKPVATPISGEFTLDFRIIKSFDDLHIGKYGILEPNSQCKPVLSDEFANSICIVPALRFDMNGYRIGYGKGYYDRFLSKFSGFSLGICYKDFVGTVPIDKYDLQVNKVITDK